MPADSTAWEEVHSSVRACQDLLAACLDAWGPQSDKVSATTKKRLITRALAGLGGGQDLLQALGAKLRQLQDASQQWESNVVQVSKSHTDLQQLLQSTSDELHACQDRQRQAEADRLAGQREADQLRQQLATAAAERQQLESTIKQLEGELQSAAFGANEASCHLNELRAQVDQLAAATRTAEETAAAATGALEAAQQEAAKERAARQRHEDAVARLTADNLVFMAKLRAAESAAAAASAERDELVLALEEHKGPWLDEVRQGVEARVKGALTRAQQLEQQQEETAAQHEAQLQQLRQQQADLEAALGQATKEEAELRQQLAAAESAAAEARTAAEEASVLAAEAQAAADARAAELRVAQDSLRSMRQECNECWMSERAARAQLAEVQEQLAGLIAERDKLAGKVQARNDELATQRAVNQQLMLKKEEVEWQLMAAIAKLNYDQMSHQSSSPLSGMHSPLSPQLAAAVAAAPAGPLQYQPSLGLNTGGGFPAGNTTCDAVTQLLTSPAQQGGSSSGHEQQQQPCFACGAGSSPFSVMLQEPFPEGSPRKAPLASRKSWSSNLADVQEEGEQPQQQQQQQRGNAGGKAAARLSTSPPQGRPSVFHTAVAAAAAASGASSSSNAVRAMAAAGGLGGLCVTTSLPAAFTAGSATHSAGSSIPDMFSLPSLSYGLATLPPPEMLAAAASRSLAGAGSGVIPAPWGDGSLRLAHSASLGMAQASLGLADIRHQGSGGSGAGVTAAAGSLSPTGSLRGSAGGAGGCRGVVVGATGGLMAPFSPLPRAQSNSLPGCFSMGSGSVGAIFPECLTASVVTDEEQQLPMRLSLPPNLLQQLQQGQQQQGVQQQQQGVQQLLQGQQQVELRSAQAAAAAAVQPSAVEAVAAGGAEAVSSAAGSVPCDVAVAVSAAGVQPIRKPPMHPAFARPAGEAAATAAASSSSSPEASPTAAAAAQSSSSSASSTPDVAPKQCSSHPLHELQLPQQQQQQVGSASGTPRSARDAISEPGNINSSSSSSHLHGILLNGPHSKPRTPVSGVSPSSSMKSVRFSFENLDQDSLQHALGGLDNGNYSDAGSKLVSPRGGKDRQELHDQCRTQQQQGAGLASEAHGVHVSTHGGSTHRSDAAAAAAAAAGVWIGAAGSYDGAGSRSSRGSAGHHSPRHPLMLNRGGSSSKLSGGGMARSPPCCSDDEEEEYYRIRSGHVSRSEGGVASRSSRGRQMLQQQQQLQQAKAAAAARAAAMVVNLPLPKGPPVHPIFGRAAPITAAAAAGQDANGGASARS